ncbi:MAG: flagellar hook-associated protein FlgK [Gammaproteobacteria bacterium]|nr:MAG: flagellar hook-associated protein FlgK [Gammaproteobacteria bacterium]
MAVGLLGTAASGLQAFQRAISVTGHNISNANTDGYTRQRVELGTRPPSFTGQGFIGNGVQVESIERVFDEFVTERLRNTTSSSSQYETLALLSGRVSNLLGDDQAGLGNGLEAFFNAVQALADDPSSIPVRQLLLAEGESLVARFHNLDTQLDSMRDEINGSLSNMVAEINSLSTAIAEANRNIVDATSQGSGAAPNDLLDERDNLINRLSELVSVRTVEQENGATNVFVGSGQSLVTGFLASELRTVPNNFDNRHLDIAVVGAGISTVITDNLTGGQLGATLDFRDRMLDPAQNGLGRIAVTVAMEFNRQHGLGMDLDGVAGTDFFSVTAPQVAANLNNTGTASVTASFDSANIDDLSTDDYLLGFDGAAWSLSRVSDGQPVTMTGSGPFFADGLQIDIAGGAAAGDRFLIRPTRSASADVSMLLGNPREIAAAASAAAPAPGDNSNALLLANLQVAQTMENATTSFQGAYGQLVGELGTQTRSAQINADAQAALLSQAQQSRDAVSGVNLDEEAANLLRFQQAYQAIAQVISVADSTFQTLLSAVRR